MTRVLGIDPGSRVTGYGILDWAGKPVLVTAGCIRTETNDFPERLRRIFEGISLIVEEFKPEEMAVEQVFMHKNADSALKLGHARGAAICAGVSRGLAVHEYAARQVKLALVGKGSADKVQVQHMVCFLLGHKTPLAMDASDALGVALCHLHHQQTLSRMNRMAQR
ncbi:crossover junction endodeoxyribonuclease RuvC [Methylococcus sp. ANG]|uniref:crossover junction endodeoxyribonuclease RuvC n=1 Tax=unclassified Methylococcus TaxID=2618889 RepID=UPI001C53174D|nr:crossover junction endodeoxyribonuclease RuvC [Methylococcus sp. Mc7]QXP82994.1 crossover junction endodeoxyribonuclease RuvC [Methylococcus sp. Mc7]